MPDLLAWSDSYNTGNAEIDKQHKQFFSYINEFHTCATVGKPCAAELYERMLQYARTHFEFEELVMVRTAYPELPQHKAQHETLLYGFSQLSISDPTMLEFLIRTWLVDHLLESDMKLAEFLRLDGWAGTEALPT